MDGELRKAESCNIFIADRLRSVYESPYNHYDINGSLPRKGEEQRDLATSKLLHRSTLKDRFEFKASAASCRREQINPAYTSQTCPECGYLDKANRKGDEFQCQICGHRGDADQIAAQNQKSRYYDQRITLYTPKETVREILLKDYQARVEHRNASSSNANGDENQDDDRSGADFRT